MHNQELPDYSSRPFVPGRSRRALPGVTRQSVFQGLTWLPLGIVVAFLGQRYWRTMPPGVSSFRFTGWSDLSEFQVVGAFWGLEHSPGYPLWTVLSNLLVRAIALVAPGTEPAWSVSFFSLITGLLTLALAFGVLRRLEIEPLLAAATTFFLGTIELFWRHAIVAEMYMLNLMLILLALWFALGWSKQERERPYLLALGLTFGAMAAHHRSALLTIPVLLLWMVSQRRDGAGAWLRRIGWLALSGATMLLFYLYLPLAAWADGGRQATRIYADATQPHLWLSMILAREWWEIVSLPDTLTGYLEELRWMTDLQVTQMRGAWLAMLGMAGLLLGGARALPLAGIVPLFIYFGLSYNAYDVDTMLLPLTTMLVLGIPLALRRLLTWLRSPLPPGTGKRVSLAGSAVAALVLAGITYQAIEPVTVQVDQSNDTIATDLIEILGVMAGDGAPMVILAHQHDPLAIVQYTKARDGLENVLPVYPNKLEAQGAAAVHARLQGWWDDGAEVYITTDAEMPSIEAAVQEGRYRLAPTYFPDMRQILPAEGLPHATRAPEYPLQARLANGLTFLGSDQRWVERRTGIYLELVLYWQAEEDVPGDYRLVLQPRGTLAETLETAIFDGFVLGGYPTSLLDAGETLRDSYLLRLNLPPAGWEEPAVEIRLEPLGGGIPQVEPVLIPVEANLSVEP